MANRAQYKRNWIAAVRTLRNANNEDAASSDSSDPDQCSVKTSNATQSIHETVASSLQDHSSDEFQETQMCLDSPDLSSDSGNNCTCLNISGQSDSDFEAVEDLLAEDLAKWANNFRVKHNALDDLPTILKSAGHPNLPSSARTLLRTARTITVQSKSGMEYLYFPLSEEIKKNVARYPCSVTENLNALELSFNIDGLPLFKSSQESLWPVLCSTANIKPAAVFPVVLTYGKSKPND